MTPARRARLRNSGALERLVERLDESRTDRDTVRVVGGAVEEPHTEGGASR